MLISSPIVAQSQVQLDSSSSIVIPDGPAITDAAIIPSSSTLTIFNVDISVTLCGFFVSILGGSPLQTQLETSVSLVDINVSNRVMVKRKSGLYDGDKTKGLCLDGC